eukprot:NODE_1015_length_2666_cov_0.637709.p2 type:complete len:276 gc:universal NODE_1015_length_2666_cov_0.637709:1649-822(-)
MSDPCSFANAVPISLDWHIEVDFQSKKLFGKTIWVLSEKSKEIIFDTKALDIRKCNGSHSLLDKHDALGTPLKVLFDEPTDIVEIEYSTTAGAEALQFLDVNQTLSHTNYLFTQCQAIHARTLLPCFDAPKLKFKYTATVTVSERNQKGQFLIPLMSALKIETTQDSDKQTTRFEQPIPIPSYLLALVVGNLVSAKIGPRSFVYSEPEIIDKCEFEFEKTEKYILAAEEILTPYNWGLYDIVSIFNVGCLTIFFSIRWYGESKSYIRHTQLTCWR